MQEEIALQLVSASRVSLGQRAALLNAAYADYFIPIRLTTEQVELMDRDYDVDPVRSIVARTRWECIGQGLLALRGQRGWISGVGVVPAWRGKGVARALMHRLIEEAAEAGAHVVTLEVVTRNTAARRLYQSLGMTEGRELLIWQRPASADPLPVPQARLKFCPPDELLDYFAGWHSQPASWQREEPSLRRMAGRLIGYRLDLLGRPAAYCLVGIGDDVISLVDVGLNPEAGPLTPGRSLLQALSLRYVGHALSITNVPVNDDLNRILAALGFVVTLRQVDMSLAL